MKSASKRWTEPVTRPDFAEWSRLLETPGTSKSFDNSIVALRQSARQRLVDAAQRYVLRLHDAAQAASVNLPEARLPARDPITQPLVLTGHQPVLFHGGLAYKYQRTEDFCAANSAIGVAVIIDTDSGDPGAFVYPSRVQAAESPIHIVEETYCSSASDFGHAKFLPAEQLEQLGERVTTHLQTGALTDAAMQFGSTHHMVRALAQAGVSPCEANTICRWTAGIGGRLLELPLSDICDFPEAMALTVDLIMRAAKFAETYNAELDQFRVDHKIRNPANPFPNMPVSDVAGQELPFWVYDSSDGRRRRLSVRTDKSGVQLFADGDQVCRATCDVLQTHLKTLQRSGIRLVPRGALVSTWLRLLFADLFVHGLGGEHYDPFTDRLIETWWQMTPSPFVTASASQYLFVSERTGLQKLESVESQLRDLRFNPQRHFGTGAFTDEQERKLQVLIDRKQSAIASMKTAHADGRSAKDIGHEIQLISDEIRASVDAAFQNDLDRLAAISPETKAAWNCRTYPWFFFA